MFIKKLNAISPQMTINEDFLNGEFMVHNEKVYAAIEPSYDAFIPASLLRRMGKAVRMGIGAGLPLIKESNKIDGIIIGTANGGLENCINFLNQIVDYEEGRLTPTNFVQSTPNAVGGQLALMDENKGYNVTHVNGALSFENALLDGIMFLENKSEPTEILIGAVEEISEYNYNIDSLGGRYKEEIVSNDQLLSSNTKGSICGEGSSMFICSNTPEDALAEILEVEQLTYPTYTDIQDKITSMLDKNNLTINEVDCIVLGKNGDIRQDHWYDFVRGLLSNSTSTYFKNYVGEYRTASSFALYLAVHLLQGKFSKRLDESQLQNSLKTILIYNHFDGVRHGFMLLRK